MAGRTPRSQSDKVRDLAAEREARKPSAGVDRKDDGIPKNNLEAIREAEQAQLLSVMSKCRTAQAEIDAAQAVLKVKRDALGSILDMAQSAGFKKGEIRDLLKDTAVKGTRKDLRETEERRTRFREYVGLPVGTQPDLLDRMPTGAMDEADWRGHGYTAGLRADEPNPKAAGVPERFAAAWLEEWHRGQETNAWALNPDKKPKPGATLGAATTTTTSDASIDTSSTATPSETASTDEPISPTVDPADNFEASAEELAAQSGRPTAEDEAV